MAFPLLSAITFTPVTVGMLLLLFPADRHTEIRITALAGATLTLF